MSAETVQVEYLRKVTFPADRKGKVGDVKSLPVAIAERLQKEKYVKIVTAKKKTTKKAKKKKK